MFNETKGFRFIVTKESEKDLFAHVKGLVDEKTKEHKAELVERQRGPIVIKVKVLEIK